MRTNGILMHITSLPSPYGIGTLGEQAYKFVDFLEKSGQTHWQILPIGPTSYGDSPYQSFSTFAGNPYLIDLDFLNRDGYLQKEEYVNENFGNDDTSIDFDLMYKTRFSVLKIACERLLAKEYNKISDFAKKYDFVDEYALFMALKAENNGNEWLLWDKKLLLRDEDAITEAKERLKETIDFYKAIQYLFFKQWYDLKHYANDKGIKIIGDLPIYVALDSVDVWSNPHLFDLDENLTPKKVAGCPPDGFSADGQLWGNPLFSWAEHEKDGYSWWISRVEAQCTMFDTLRIDHFRGFDEYFTIPFGDTTAKHGNWKKGPGIKLFNAIKERIGNKNIIAEDLGFLTPSVEALLKATGYPGMKILLFGFDTRDTGSGYLPHVYTRNSVAYIGTHDNDTLYGWLENAPKDDVAIAHKYLRLNKDEGYHFGAMRALWSSVADTTIIQMQDVLGLDNSARMNVPSTLGENWKWRMKDGALTDELASSLLFEMKLYGRNRQTPTGMV